MPRSRRMRVNVVNQTGIRSSPVSFVVNHPQQLGSSDARLDVISIGHISCHVNKKLPKSLCRLRKSRFALRGPLSAHGSSATGALIAAPAIE